MRSVEPEVLLVARPQLDYAAVAEYLREVGGEAWLERLDRGDLDNDAQNLAEFAGRLCYRSWEPGLNPNVTRIRTDQAKYLENILASAHGSVLEHLNFTFVLHNVSRVLSHEVVRHQPGDGGVAGATTVRAAGRGHPVLVPGMGPRAMRN